MKTFTSKFLKTVMVSFVLTSMTQTSALAAQSASKEVVINLNDVYVPNGFDSTADSYVVVNGIFPNGCYKWKEAQVNNVDSFNHEITSVASVNQGMCIMVLMPFTKEVRLGKLSSGTHNLKFLNGDGTYMQKSMVIE